MIKKKHVLVLALTFCLTTTLFVAVSIGYDPWVDQDEDGDVDATDLNMLAGEYGSSGDPTKNVSVTNFPLDEEGNIKVRTGHSYIEWFGWLPMPPYANMVYQNITAGYKDIYIDIHASYEITFWFSRFMHDSLGTLRYLNQSSETITGDIHKHYSVSSQGIELEIQNNMDIWNDVWIHVYITD